MRQLYFAERLLKRISLNKRVIVRPSFCIGVCISLFILPIPWVLAWLAASLIHELGHIVALRILRVPVLQVTLDFKGTFIETGYMAPFAEFISALTGPLAGLSCLFFSQCFPLLAVCGFVQTVFNLLPYPDYDGGRALTVVLDRFLSAAIAERVYQGVLITLTVLLLFFGVYLWVCWNLGPIIFFICMIPLIKSRIVKIPCKGREQIVQ